MAESAQQNASDPHADLAALIWLVELGGNEPILDAPINRYDLPETRTPAPAVRAASPPAPAPAAPAPAAPAIAAPAVASTATAPEAVAEAVAEAGAAAARATSLDALQAELAAYEHCEIKRGARSLVFADGLVGARVMLVGEAPGREEDREGRPFVGKAGQLLDRMLAAIGLSRSSQDAATAIYIANVMPWRPPQDRDPNPAEIAMMLPFITRHIDLAAPELIVLVGNTSLYAATGAKSISRMRGTWITAYGRPALPVLHPAHLLRNPSAKREAWADLLTLGARLAEQP